MGHLLKIKSVDSRMKMHILAAKNVPFKLSTVQVPNLALTHKKRITVYIIPVLRISLLKLSEYAEFPA